MDFNYGEITDKMTNCCDEISDPTPILVASRIAQDHDPIKAGSFVESDRIEKSWADEKLVIRSLFHSDRIFSGIGPWSFLESGPDDQGWFYICAQPIRDGRYFGTTSFIGWAQT